MVRNMRVHANFVTLLQNNTRVDTNSVSSYVTKSNTDVSHCLTDQGKGAKVSLDYSHRGPNEIIQLSKNLYIIGSKWIQISLVWGTCILCMCLCTLQGQRFARSALISGVGYCPCIMSVYFQKQCTSSLDMLTH